MKDKIECVESEMGLIEYVKIKEGLRRIKG